jgi:hypothetical protein
MHRMSLAALFTRLIALLLVLALLLSAACTRRRGPAPPDLVLFASGAVFGQLETCG